MLLLPSAPESRTRILGESNPHRTFMLDRLAWTLFAYIPPLSWGGGFLQFSVALHTKMTCAQAIMRYLYDRRI